MSLPDSFKFFTGSSHRLADDDDTPLVFASSSGPSFAIGIEEPVVITGQEGGGEALDELARENIEAAEKCRDMVAAWAAMMQQKEARMLQALVDNCDAFVLDVTLWLSGPAYKMTKYQVFEKAHQVKVEFEELKKCCHPFVLLQEDEDVENVAVESDEDVENDTQMEVDDPEPAAIQPPPRKRPRQDKPKPKAKGKGTPKKEAKAQTKACGAAKKKPAKPKSAAGRFVE